MDLNEIKEIVNNVTGLDITHNSRIPDYVYARAMFYKVCRDYNLGTFQSIANIVDKNHATIVHGVNLFDDWISKHEPNYIEMYDTINKKVASLCKREAKKFKSREYFKSKYIKSIHLNRSLIKQNQQLKEILKNLNEHNNKNWGNRELGR
jgi:hypothetical protein